MKMTIQIILSKKGRLYLKLATELLPDAIGEVIDNNVVLYLKNGEKFGLDPIQNINMHYGGDIYNKMERIDFRPEIHGITKNAKYSISHDVESMIKFIYNRYDDYKLLKELYNESNNSNDLNLYKYQNIHISYLADILKGSNKYNGTDKNVQIYKIENMKYFDYCVSIKHLDYFIHYVKRGKYHYHFTNGKEKVTKNDLANDIKCKKCEYCLSAFMKISSVKSARSKNNTTQNQEFDLDKCDNFYIIDNDYQCMSIKYTDHYFHCIVHNNVRSYLVNNKEMLTKEDVYNSINLSAKINDAKSARS